MTRYLVLPLTLILSLAFSSNALAGKKAPTFKLQGENGEISLEQYKGQVVYVDFWASWCVPCKHSFPWMNDIQKRYGNKGFKVIAINLDKDKKDAHTFLKMHPAEFTIAYDPEGIAAEAYRVKVMPTAYLIDQQGNLVNSHKGFKIEDSKKMEAAIRKLQSK